MIPRKLMKRARTAPLARRIALTSTSGIFLRADDGAWSLTAGYPGYVQLRRVGGAYCAVDGVTLVRSTKFPPVDGSGVPVAMTAVPGAPTMSAYAVSPGGVMAAFPASGSRALRISTDGGLTWVSTGVERQEFIAGTGWIRADRLSIAHFAARWWTVMETDLGQNLDLASSADGVTWTRHAASAPAGWLAGIFSLQSDGPMLLALTITGGAYYLVTTTDGVTWTRTTAPVAGQPAMRLRSGTLAVMQGTRASWGTTGPENQFHVSDDGGSTWTSTSFPSSWIAARSSSSRLARIDYLHSAWRLWTVPSGSTGRLAMTTVDPTVGAPSAVEETVLATASSSLVAWAAVEA